MPPKSIMIHLGDADGFTAGPALSDLGVDFSPQMERAAITAISLREQAFHEWCEELADELNSALSQAGFEVRLTHVDSANYLEFVPRPAEETETEAE